jgi:ATP-binding cassette subfamily C protein CydC
MALAGERVAAAAVASALAVPALLRLLGGGRIVLRYLERLATHAATFRALADLRVWLFRRLAAGSAGGLGFRRAGDLLTRLVDDVQALDGLYMRVLVPSIGALLVLPALAWVIGSRDPLLALVVSALFVVVALLVPWISTRAASTEGERVAAAMAGVRVAALDAVSGVREVRAFGAEGRMLALLQARESTLLAAQRALAAHGARANAAAFLCGQAALFAILLAAGTEPVAAVAASFLVIAAFEAASILPRAGAEAAHAAAAARRVLAAAEMRSETADPTSPASAPTGFVLRFEQVRFSWEPDRPLVFDGLNLDVPERSRIAVVGPSGIGKSSLAALALKVVKPDSGRVLLGGVDLAGLPSGVVRSRIAWLSQATHLFDDTIRANLRLARPDADEAALWAALEAARIGEVVRALPEQLDTWVGEGGAGFSGGQGRRLALARTLLSSASVLILDEPCAGLDAETERAFLATLNEVAEGRSVILIAHRLVGVERLDRIWRLTGGRAVAAAA